MLKQIQRAATSDDLRRFNNRNWVAKLLSNVGLSQTSTGALTAAPTNVYAVSVEGCLVCDPEGEFPVYFLDVGEGIMIVFGAWLLDPYIVVGKEEMLDQWNSGREFFSRFSISCASDTGVVYRLVVEGTNFVAARPLKAQLKFRRLKECEVLKGTFATIIQDLEAAGIVAPGGAE